ncbi:MAG: hypothetical protein ACSHWY_10665 [Octadecabacter sp.]
MTKISMAALGAAILLGACTPPEITSRLDSSDALYSGFDSAENYTPRPIAGRQDNDFMRFSTMSLTQ